ncbi:hypothetical protein THAOC_04183, partial [Thalassiosira oceanica]
LQPWQASLPRRARPATGRAKGGRTIRESRGARLGRRAPPPRGVPRRRGRGKTGHAEEHSTVRTGRDAGTPRKQVQPRHDRGEGGRLPPRDEAPADLGRHGGRRLARDDKEDVRGGRRDEGGVRPGAEGLRYRDAAEETRSRERDDARSFQESRGVMG